MSTSEKSWRMPKAEFEEWCDNFLYEKALPLIEKYKHDKNLATKWITPYMESLWRNYPNGELYPPKNKRQRNAMIRVVNTDMDLFGSGAFITDRLTICRYAILNAVYGGYITAYTYLTNSIKNRSVDFVKELCFIIGGHFSFENWTDAAVNLNWDLFVTYPKHMNRFQILEKIAESDPDPDRQKAAEIFMAEAKAEHREKYREKLRDIRKKDTLIQNLFSVSKILSKIAGDINIQDEIHDFCTLTGGKTSEDYTPTKFIDYLMPRIVNIYTVDEDRETRRLVREALSKYKLSSKGRTKKKEDIDSWSCWKPVMSIPSRIAKDAKTKHDRAERLLDKKIEEEEKLREWYTSDPKIVINPSRLDWYSIMGIHTPTRREFRDYEKGIILPSNGTSGYLVRQLEEDAPKPATAV